MPGRPERASAISVRRSRRASKLSLAKAVPDLNQPRPRRRDPWATQFQLLRVGERSEAPCPAAKASWIGISLNDPDEKIMTINQASAIWGLCRQGLPLSADEAELCWWEGRTYCLAEPVKLPREVEALIAQCNWELIEAVRPRET
jgi:hypothetical protein